MSPTDDRLLSRDRGPRGTLTTTVHRSVVPRSIFPRSIFPRSIFPRSIILRAVPPSAVPPSAVPLSAVLVSALVLLAGAWSCGPRTGARSDADREPERAPAAQPAPEAQPPAATTPAPARRASSLQEEYRAIALENRCPNGYPTVQGGWRFIGETKADDFSDELTVRGLKFTEHIAGKADDGKPLTADLTGEIRCLFNNRVLVMVDTVTPPGAFGNKAGDAYPCDVLGDISGKGERMLLVCYSDWDMRTSAGLDYEYERTAR